VFRLHFTAAAGQSYTIQYTTSVAVGPWLKLKDISSQPSTQAIEVTDPVSANAPQKFYRIVTPAQP
jgi:hypothetical protein